MAAAPDLVPLIIASSSRPPSALPGGCVCKFVVDLQIRLSEPLQIEKKNIWHFSGFEMKRKYIKRREIWVLIEEKANEKKRKFLGLIISGSKYRLAKKRMQTREEK